MVNTIFLQVLPFSFFILKRSFKIRMTIECIMPRHFFLSGCCNLHNIHPHPLSLPHRQAKKKIFSWVVQKRCTRIKTQGDGMGGFSKKFWVGSRFCCEKFQGGPQCLGFIAFLLTSYLKIFLGILFYTNLSLFYSTIWTYAAILSKFLN